MKPIYTAGLFRPLHAELMALLRSLAPADWERPTVARGWRVRDVAAHLVDGDLRKLSAYRDGHAPPPAEPIRGNDDLVRFLNTLNAEWVTAFRRLSPRVLVELLDFTGPMVAELMETLPPHGPSLFPVGWAGESASENWFDTGREYTERWHHQMQIRDGVGAPGLLEPRWLHPLLDLSARALPHAYRDTPAAEGAAVVLRVGDDAWSLVRGGDAWRLRDGATEPFAARVTLEPDAAWRLFFNALPDPGEHARIEGDPALAGPLLATRSVMV